MIEDKQTISKLILSFVEEGEARHAAWRKLDVPAYNRRVERVIDIAKKLREMPGGREALAPLMDHPDPYVRLGAAYQCLDHPGAREKAVATIRELATTPSIAQDHASVPLWDIEHGTL